MNEIPKTYFLGVADAAMDESFTLASSGVPVHAACDDIASLVRECDAVRTKVLHFLERHGISQTMFARDHGIDPGYFSYFVHNKWANGAMEKSQRANDQIISRRCHEILTAYAELEAIGELACVEGTPATAASDGPAGCGDGVSAEGSSKGPAVVASAIGTPYHCNAAPPPAKAPCQYCGQLYTLAGKGLLQHESHCRHRQAAIQFASHARHSNLVGRLEDHMKKCSLRVIDLVSRLGVTSSAKLAIWPGRGAQFTRGGAAEREVDALVAAYLDAIKYGHEQETYGDEGANVPPPRLTERPAANVAKDGSGALPPRGCRPPSASAGQYEAGRRVQSSDGSTWVVEAEMRRDECYQLAAKLRRVDVDAGGGGQGPTVQPCQYCGQPYNLAGNGLLQHERRCPHRDAPIESAASNPAAELRHADLVQRLKQHMAAHDLTQAAVASAARISSDGKLSSWLGCSTSTLVPDNMRQVDALVAAYLRRMGVDLGVAATAADMVPAQRFECIKCHQHSKPQRPRHTREVLQLAKRIHGCEDIQDCE